MDFWSDKLIGAPVTSRAGPEQHHHLHVELYHLSVHARQRVELLLKRVVIHTEHMASKVVQMEVEREGFRQLVRGGEDGKMFYCDRQ